MIDPQIHVPDRRELKVSAEALTREALAQLQWRDAEKACRQWVREEPFATTPPEVLSSLLCTHLRDYKGAVDSAEAGLAANPNSPTLLNNRAFALANLGRIVEAEADITKILKERMDQNRTNQICVTATKGLIAFRDSRPEEGEIYYRRAMAMARAERTPDLAAGAGIYLIHEARRAGINHLAQDSDVLKLVYAKDLTPATECLRKQLLDKGWQRLLTDVANLSRRADGLQRSLFETSPGNAKLLLGQPPDKNH